jgi:hypothetical protein
MDEDRPEDTLPPDSGRARRAPPTIDLEASEVSGGTQSASAGAGAEPKQSFQGPRAGVLSAMVTSAVTGAVTTALVLATAWYVGWPGETAAPPPANAAVIDTLTSRLAEIESRSAGPAATAPDPAAMGRVEALEKSIAALRSEIAGARAQSEKLAADVNAVKSASRESTPPDLDGINERLGQIERATRAESAVIAQQSNKPADDAVLRRVVVASMLDISVRQGEPFAAALAAAKSLAADAAALKPLDDFAASGVPSAALLSRELLTLVPKLSPPAPEIATTGSGIVDRLQAGAAKLVRIERTDAVGNDRSAVIARVTAAALRNDSAEARHELNTLAPADRAAAQPWLDKADERDAALAASRQFAADAMAALAKPAP